MELEDETNELNYNSFPFWCFGRFVRCRFCLGWVRCLLFGNFVCVSVVGLCVDVLSRLDGRHVRDDVRVALSYDVGDGFGTYECDVLDDVGWNDVGDDGCVE